MDKRDIVVLTEDEKRERAKISRILSKEITLPSSVYSYTKGKSVKSAVESVRSNINKYNYFTKIDIKHYFESINQDILIGHLKELVDPDIVKKVEDILNEDKRKYNKNGLIVGSPLSNILSNIYLINFDIYFSELADVKYYRFADDILILSNEKIDIDDIERRLGEYNLKLNEEKTLTGSYGDSFLYLGEEVITEGGEGERNEESNKEFLILLKKENLNEEDKCKLKKIVKDSKNIELKYLYRYKLNGEIIDDLVEEMIENNLYKEVYKLYELVDLLEENNSYNKFKELFISAESIFYKSKIEDGRLEYEEIKFKITSKEFENHINGKYCFAKNLNSNGKSNILVLDLDNKSDLDKAKKEAEKIQNILLGREIDSYIEFSGMKGYHVWIFFYEYIEIDLLNIWIERILEKASLTSNIEIRPKKEIIAESEEIIKLPLGLHPISNERCEFLDILSISEINLNYFIDNEDKVFEFWNIIESEYKSLYDISKKCSIVSDIITFGIVNKNISHSNRLILSYIFSKLENGRDFIHLIMGNMRNYNYNITDKFISKAPEHPISCKKLKEYFKSGEINCSNCIFPNIASYKTPILHCNDTQFIEVHIKSEIKNIIDSMVELQKERKEMDKKINKLNKKLDGLYSQLDTNEVQLDMGKLKKHKDKWIIEIGI
ncbi:reverse transcriptase domain-containing protein [Clostridium perfringens]|uniref:reverse transcriptase domain-containing protein n=1 Tax=Clostridium perfringens TaxID=1502 RepID=UPI0039E94893